MSIEEGDEVVTVEAEVGEVTNPDAYGGVHVSFPSGVGYSYHEKKLAKVDEPLRVRVDSEQEARELVEMAEENGLAIWGPCYESTDSSDADLSEIDNFMLHFGPKKRFDCYQTVDFSDRRAQVEAYISYHAEDELTHDTIQGEHQCRYCGADVFEMNDSPECPEHPDRHTMSDSDDRQREDEGGLREAIEKGRKDYEEGRTTPHEDVFDSGDQAAEDDDELGEWVNRRANLSDFELSDDEVQNVVEFIRKNDDEVDFFSLDKEEANERLDKLIVVEATAGMLNDLSEEEQKRYREASERRPLFDEDDDDGEGDVSREIAERFMDGESIVSIQSDDPSALKGSFEQAIRDHCELSDGVCEWTWDGTHKKWDTDCDQSFQFEHGDIDENSFDNCMYCGREITTDEGGEYEAGDLVEVVEFEGYDYIYEVSDDRYRTIGSDDKVWYPKEDFTKHADKIGSFAPDDDALERVSPECNGSLFITDDKVLFDPLCRTKDIEFSGSELLFTDEGRGYKVQGAEATGIVLESFHQIAEVSDGNIDK